MKTLLIPTALALALLAGCTATPLPPLSEADLQYEYGYFAGLPMRPTLME